MTRYSKVILSMLLWVWGGATYFMLEVAYKTLTGHPERISWTMLVVAALLCVPVERCGEEFPWDVPLWLQAAWCAAVVTIVELFAGLILNCWLQLNIWDYSELLGNICGQICPQYTLVWFALCFLFIPVFDWMRWAIEGGERPTYVWR